MDILKYGNGFFGWSRLLPASSFLGGILVVCTLILLKIKGFLGLQGSLDVGLALGEEGKPLLLKEGLGWLFNYNNTLFPGGLQAGVLKGNLIITVKVRDSGVPVTH